MKSLSLYFKRGLALVLAMALVLSCSNLGLALSVFAADGEAVTKTDGQIVAENYELTAEEEKLLESGLLAGESHTYSVPGASDELISVDADTKTITAKSYTKDGYTWNPVSAAIVVGNETKEEVVLADGVGTYAYAENAFAVVVSYAVNVQISADAQNKLLTSGAALKHDVAQMDAIAATDDNVTLIAAALTYLEQLANGIAISQYVTVGLATDDAKDAVRALVAQYNANSKMLDLTVMTNAYKASASKTAYALTEGKAYCQKLAETLAYVQAIRSDDLFAPGNALFNMLPSYDNSMYVMLMLLLNTMDSFKTAAEAIDNDLQADASMLKTGITDAEYIVLDGYVDALGETTSVDVAESLLMDETTIQFNMSMFDVTVIVKLEVITNVPGSAELVEYGTKSTVITLGDGVTAEQIAAAVEDDGIVNSALNAWAGVYSAEHFEASYSLLPETLGSDIEYVITYSPKNYNVTLDYGENLVVPYGYQLVLEKSTSATQVYDYTVNGAYVPEGSTIVIEGDTTIDRKTGKPYTNYNLYAMVAEQYGNTSEDAILLSGALKGNVAVNLRYPDSAVVTLDETAMTLTANGYDASYSGLVWKPVSYTIDGGNAIAFGAPASENVWVANLNVQEFSKVTVLYQLALTNLEDDALEALNLPAMLVEEAAVQKSALDRLSADSYMGNMAQLDRTKLGALNGVIDVTDLYVDENGAVIDEAKNAELKAYFKDVVGSVIANCLEGNQLRIYGMLAEYKAQGLGYYYANSEKFTQEIELLSSYLTAMLADEDKVNAMKVMTAAAGYSEYVDKIADLERVMAEVTAALTAPNAIIDLNSANLNTLANLLTAETTSVDSYNALPAAFVLETSFSKNSAGQKTLGVTVIVNGKEIAVEGDTLANTVVLTDAHINKLVAGIENAAAAVNNAHYTSNYSAAALRSALEGKTAIEASKYLSDLVYTWTPVTYTVTVNGVETKITVEDGNRTVILPASTDSTKRYEYYIDGVRYSGSVEFSVEMIENLFVDGKYTVELKIVDLGRETLIDFVNKVNDSIGSDDIALVLFEDAGKFSIVLRVDASNPGALSNAAMGTVMGLINGGYSYIGMDGNDVLYFNEENSLEISLQAIVDTIMDSGFGKATILNVIDANGNVNNMTLNGQIVSNAAPAALGGKLIATTMELGDTVANATSYPFYITLGGAPGALTTVRNALAGKAGNYVNFVLDEGKTNVDLTLPGKAYEAYLAALLVTNEIDLSDVGAVNAEIAYTFLMDLVEPALDESVTLDTYLNTLSKLGFDLSLGENKSLATKIYNTVRDQYKKLTFTYDKVSGETTAHFGIKAILDKLAGDKADLLGMVKEYNTGLDITANLELTNLITDYEALYIDISADGITNKAGFTTNLDAKSFAGASVIVLLQDVTADLELNGTSIVNLNGYTLTGNITGSGSVTVVDASFEGEGKLNGTYGDNVSVMPANDFYTLKRDANGDVVMSVNADIIAMRQMPSIKNLVIDVACDLLFNGYTSNKLYVGSNKVYELTVDDLVALYAEDGKAAKAFEVLTNLIDDADLANIVNSVIADLTDFAAVQAAVENGTAVMSYEIITAPWAVEVEHITSGDYLTANIATGADKQTTFKVVVVGSEENKQLLADMLAVLAETTTVNVKLTASDYVNGSVWTHDWTASAAVEIDFTVNPDYAVMICTILADGLTGTNRTALVEGIKAVYAEKSTKKLEKAFNNLKVSDIITAIENIARNDSFEAMVNNLGLKGIVADSVYELADTCSLVTKVLGAAMRKLDIDRGSRLMSSFLKNGAYTADKSGFARSASANLFAGYSVAVNAEITEVSVSVKLFGEVKEVKDPAFVEGTGTPEVKLGGLIAGAHVVALPEGGIIYIDAHVDGITAAQLVEQLTFYAENADTINVEVVGTEADALVVNGATVKAVASNNESEVTDEITYTVIVMGDVNCNGTNDVTDGSQMAKYWIGDLELSDVAVLAFNMNWNGGEDVADAVTLAEKWITDWEDYESHLNAQ